MKCIGENCKYYSFHLFFASARICLLNDSSFSKDNIKECPIDKVILDKERKLRGLKEYKSILPNLKQGDDNIKECKICKKSLSRDNKSGYCQIHYREFLSEEKIRKWLETGETGCGTSTTLRSKIRDYIYETQNNKCAICGLERIWNGKELKFILDHIDGDASNDWQNNLRLVCPNCDSQLETFKSKNKNSARSFRK